jgi:hypothetical protein
VYADLAGRLSPRRRRGRLARFLELGTPRALDVAEAVFVDGGGPSAVPDAARARLVERWTEERARLARAAAVPEVAARAPLADAIARRRRALDRRVVDAGGRLVAPRAIGAATADEALAALAAHPDRWIQVCAKEREMPSTIERVLFLKETPLFAEVDPSVLVHVAERVEPRALKKGTLVVRAHERTAGIFIVRSGRVEVTQARDEGRARIAILGPRDSIGELSVLNDSPATADCTALDDVDCLFVPAPVLAQLLHQHPRLAIGMMRMLGQRLIATTRKVGG